MKVDGCHVQSAEPEVFVLLHKPPGYVTTMNDPYGRPTIADLLAKVKVRVFPVGRLDYDTEGLLLLTNNGDVAQACVHPRYHVPKTYLVKVSGACTDEEIRNLQDGIALDDGVTAPASIKKSGKTKANSWLELTIHEGRKHQIKRMIEALGHRVMRIKRIRFGPIVLGDLPVGVCRFATDAEAKCPAEGRSSNDQDPKRSCAGSTVRLAKFEVGWRYWAVCASNEFFGKKGSGQQGSSGSRQDPTARTSCERSGTRADSKRVKTR